MEKKTEDKIQKLADGLPNFFRDARKESMRSPFLKKRLAITCKCKRQKSNENSRKKYGVCRCDAFSLNYTLGVVISNYLYQYLADARSVIMREDWETIEKHADAIRVYIQSDSWDLLSKERGVKSAFQNKEREWRNAMKWVTNNWQTLWW